MGVNIAKTGTFNYNTHDILHLLQRFEGDLTDVVHSSIRRTLCFPLYRHWGLAQAVLEDTKTVFLLGN